MYQSANILFIITTLLFFSLYIYTPTLPIYAQGLGAPLALVGMLTGVYGIVQGILRVPLGVASDKLKKRKPFVVLGCAALTLSALGFLLVRDAGFLLVFRGLGGVAVSAWVTIIVLFASYFPPEKAAAGVGMANAANYLGCALGCALGGYAAELGDSFPFILSLSAGGVALALTFFLKDTQPEGEPMRLRSFVRVAKSGYLWLTSLIALFIILIAMTLPFTFSPIVAKELGATNGQVGLLTMTHLIPMIFLAYKGHAIVRRFGLRATVFAGSALCVLPCVLTTSVDLFGSFVLQAVLGVGSALSFNTCISVCMDPFAPTLHSSVMGLFQTIYSVGIFIGPSLTGALMTSVGYHTAFFIVGGAGVLAALLALLLPKRQLV